MKAAPAALVVSGRRDFSLLRRNSPFTSERPCPGTKYKRHVQALTSTYCSRSLHSTPSYFHVSHRQHTSNNILKVSSRKIHQSCRASLAASIKDTSHVEVEPCDALIVGAGPSGLGSALMLGQRSGWKRIVVLELRPSVDSEEAHKSYVYMIDGRGQALTDAAGLSGALDEAGVSTKSMNITAVNPDGTAQTRLMSIKDRTRYNVWLPRRALLRVMHSGLKTHPLTSSKAGEANAAKETDAKEVSGMTADHQEQEQAGGPVRILYSTKVTAVHLNGALASTSLSAQTHTASVSTLLSPAGGPSNSTQPQPSSTSPPPPLPQSPSSSSPATATIVVHAVDMTSGKTLAFAPRLLVGADGLNSGVHRALQDWATTAGLPTDHFKPITLDSPSAGLRFKILQLPPNTPYRKPSKQSQRNAPSSSASSSSSGGRPEGTAAAGDGVLPNASFCKIVGVQAPRRRSMSLGMLPVRDPTAPRTGNIIAAADHEVWSMTTGQELGGFLQESFPQLDIGALFTPEQLQAAAAARGGTFPRPQYLRHFTAALRPSVGASIGAGGGGADADAPGGERNVCGVALVGDVVHCFPPDLGQGVNSALQDVMGLVKALDEAGEDLATALARYESSRAPEAEALVRLMTFSAPYQYNQDLFRRTLWFVNMAVRSALSGVAPWLFSPASFMLVQQADLNYAEVLSRVHATTARLQTVLSALILAWVASAVKGAIEAARSNGPA